MTGSDTPPIGAPCWIDLSTTDADASRRFYSQLLGWKAEEPSEEFGGYFMFTRGGMPVGGGMPALPDQPINSWTIYLVSDDAARTADAVSAAGGQVVMPTMPVADLGTMALFVDPGGATIGTWQAGTFSGFAGLGQAGAPAWFELYARDYDGALSFYRDAFRWEVQPMSDSPELRYSTLGSAGDPRAGIYDAAADLPTGAPSRWSVYFGVDDTDATVARAIELGATVTDEAKDTPYGRMASLVDPVGAAFKLVAVRPAG